MNDITRPITSHIGSASFSFLTSDDIRSVSVKSIVNPVLLDNTNTPTSGGLYDPALGPMKKEDICQTCHQTSYRCPGHFGHIELPAPVFHPLFMTHAHNLLRGCCLFCHRFKLGEQQRIIYTARFRLLEYGLVEAADDLANATLLRQRNFAVTDDDEAGPSRGRGRSGSAPALQAEDGDGQLKTKANSDLPPETLEEFEDRIQAEVSLLIQQAARSGEKRHDAKDGTVYTARKRLIGEFLKAILVKRRCQSCEAVNPALRKDGFVKIVEKELSERDKALHTARGIRRPDPIKLWGRLTARGAAQGDGGGDEDAMAVDGSDDEEIQIGARTVDKNQLKEARKKSKDASTTTRVMPPVECRANLRLLFRNENVLCSLIFGRHGPFEQGRLASKSAGKQTDNGASADAFFMDVVAVAPTRFRPASVMGDTTFENPQNELLTKIIQTTFSVRALSKELALLTSKGAQEMAVGDEVAAQKAHNKAVTAASDSLMTALIQLQVDVNSFIDSSKNPTPVAAGALPPAGVKQALEKKEGLFRKHMMGKRVNFAARSVISPDVNIETNEIGVPPVFAQKLTFPEPVTVHNVHLMRQLVINGPDTYPGAVAVRSEDGSETLLGKKTVEERTAIANQLLTPQERTSRQSKGTFAGLGTTTRTPPANKTVLRHLRDGDILLLNRQPTLHKPSIMAHKARVLTGERTIRMHYANCNSYNADFDGDEMNMHFPQSQAARAECYNIANTDNQYLVPTSGKPLRGLIQDHVVAGVWMTCKDSLFTRQEYQQLLYGALRPEEGYSGGGRVLTLPPAVIKPRPRWTGKQIISTILLNLKPASSDGINLTSKAKVAGRYWGTAHADEEKVVFNDGELLSGVLDKSQFGATAYGIVHAVYELYGPDTAGKLLSVFSRLFTKYLQHSAFSCRMDDLMLSEKGDAKRAELLTQARDIGRQAALRSVGLDNSEAGFAETDYNMRVRLEEVLRDDNKLAALDAEAMSASNQLSSAVIDACIPHGLYKTFPHNNMQMMTVSGAKGSPVNVSQISCLLGSQALEGRRVPVMVSGKTLPSFKPFETSAKAGGFVASRFLTGISPQEYYFHCMAGREGLIDTAVKTSRSGYLQRCLVKHLEGVHVHYDHTVRNSDGTVLQFLYGEDSLDVMKSKYLEQFDFTIRNFDSFLKRYDPAQLQGVLEESMAADHMKRALKKPHKVPPVLSVLPPAKHIGAMSEKFARKVESYIEANPGRLLAPGRKSKKKARSDDAVVEDRLRSVKAKIGPEAFRVMTKVLYHRGLVEPGEAVGLLAAEGVGEPSTQMTLNTFHFAGHGAANVTLGIPRLREIVMTASQKIKTPIMKLPIRDGITMEQMRTFCKDGSRLLLSQVVDTAQVTERISPKSLESDFKRRKTYTVRLNFFPPHECLEEYNTTTAGILTGLEATFVPILEREIIKELRRLARDRTLQRQFIGHGERFNDAAAGGQEDGEDGDASPKAKNAKASARRAGQNADDSDDDEDDDDEGADGDASDAKRKQKAGAHASYDEGDDEARPAPDSVEALEAALGGDDESSSDSSSDDGDVDSDIEQRVHDLEEKIQSNAKYVTRFDFDKKAGMWAKLELQLPSNTEKVLLINVVERACRRSVVHEIPNISRILIPPPAPGEKQGMTAEGINFPGLWNFGYGVVDLDKIYTNDVGALLHTYGVEAAQSAIVAEMSGIFGTYGIDVAPSHLMLIASYMTNAGGYRPFNRAGITDASSVLLKASYEMTSTFLANAVLYGETDALQTPSSSLVVGRPVHGGSNFCDVRLPLVRA